MSASDPSKETPSSFNPGYPPVYGAAPMPGYPPVYGAGPPGVNAGYNSPPYNPGYTYGHSGVVTTQPMVIVAPPRAYETDYLGYSIFTMLCCCLPIGIGALIYSIKTRDANNVGDAAQARKNSRTALTLNNVALGVGITLTLAWAAYVIYVNIVIGQYINEQNNG
ncbi:proline rich transmembrane protein 1B-like [Lissotriton helveticus]